MRNTNKHVCAYDDRGLCESCETVKRAHEMSAIRWAADIVELSRVMMVERVAKGMEMVMIDKREEMVNA